MLKNYFLLISIVLIASCGSSWNFYSDFGDKDTKEALIEEAKFRIDKGNYTGAIELLDVLSTRYPKDADIALLRSSAYAGAGNIGLLNTATNIGDLKRSTNIIETPLAGYFILVADPEDSEINYALEAIDSLVSFEDSASKRTNEMNMYLSVISYAAVATVLSARADIYENDDEVDAGISCSDFSDTDILNIIYIYAVAKQSVIETTSSSVWTDIKEQIISFTDAVELLGVDLSITNEDEITDSDCEIVKSFVLGGLTGLPNICTCSL